MKNIFCKASPIVMILTLALALSGCSSPTTPEPQPDPVRLFTVTFNANYGTPAITAVQVEQGNTVNQPENDPTRLLWTFVGWFTHQTEGIAPFHFNSAIWTDLTLWARWSENPIPVTFNLRGGEWNLEQNFVYAAPGNAVARPINIPVKESYVFAGWFTHPTAPNTAWDFDTPITQAVTLYAHWDPYVRVTFNLQGGEWEREYYYVYIPPRTTVQKPEHIPTLAHYDFRNWYANPAGTILWSFDAPITSNVTIHAGWAETWFTVTFDATRGTPAPPDQSIRSGHTVDAPVGVDRTNQPYDQGLFRAPAVAGTAWDNWTVYWYHGNTRWDFSTPLLQDINLTARWRTPYGPINLAGRFGPNIVHHAFHYIEDTPGDYYLFLTQSINNMAAAFPGPGTANTGIGEILADNSRLKLIGLGGQRYIRRSTANPARLGTLFNIETGAELIIGNNITLASGDLFQGLNPLVIVRPTASFTMLPGSHVTQHRLTTLGTPGQGIGGNVGAAVMVMNNATFTMKGGEISGNTSQGAFIDGASALHAWPGSTINLQGGRIVDNLTFLGSGFARNGIVLGMFTNLYTPINFTVSDEAEIEDVAIVRFGDGPAMATQNTITIDQSWIGTAARLNLTSLFVLTKQDGIDDLWEDTYVLSPVPGQILTSALVSQVTTGEFFTGIGPDTYVETIADTHFIAADGKLEFGTAPSPGSFTPGSAAMGAAMDAGGLGSLAPFALEAIDVAPTSPAQRFRF